ncbi:MAG: asparagine synthase (glutamine-hydrolyzing) [Deltaproteobacteria bacterium]|nr:MAG: asparagine synthase (glutamine-hydrolyzing) [Deltaproteobacteria bacterium]
MCGIAGAIGFVDDDVIEAVSRAHDALRHRGPDGEGTWQNVQEQRGVALAHRRLAIIDLSADGAQPMHDVQAGLTVVFNGEIYNFAVLRAELEALGHVFRTRTDTEVLLKAHAAWGDDAVERLNGMFAYALWDSKRRRTLLVRDRMGIKPLYFTRLGRTLLFASEVRALLATGLVDRKLDHAALNSYLWNGFVVGPQTIIEDVELLPAGSMLAVLDSGEWEPIRYWRQPATDGTHGDTTELRDRLLQSVRMRLVADVPLGVFLSGGIDSSALAALASQVSDQPVQTFNISFDETEFDESPYAKQVAKSIGSEHHDIRLTQQHFASQLDDALASIDQPTFDAINTYFVSRAVREAGLTVALAGTGGDELFGGYTSFQELPTAMRWSRYASVMPEAWLRAGAAAITRFKTGRPGEVRPQTRWGKLGDALATRGDLLKMYQVSYGLFTQAFLEQLCATEADEVEYGLPVGRARELEREPSSGGVLGGISQLEQALFLGERLLRDTDAASMAVALEVRVPLLDHTIVEALAMLRETTRFAPLGQKRLLRELGLGGVDPSLFDRPKSGFVLPLDVWCRRQVKDVIDATFADTELCTAVGLRPEAVGRLWRSYQEGAPGLYWSRVWSLFVLLNWCREHGVTL